MLFDSNGIKKNKGHVKLYTEKIVQFENKYCENLQRGTPKWWDDYLLQNITIDDYRIYFICSCTLPNGQYNRMTDYKKVWGLNGLEQGIYDNTYKNDVGKVYFGIIQTQGEEAFRSNIASMIFLVKKEYEIDCDDIFRIFQKCRYDFRNVMNMEDGILVQICDLYKESILLQYNCTKEISLNIYGNNIEQLFSSLNINKYDNYEDDVIFRKS